jgi:dipeptidyl aminopeptidase/acylaminoacyl peptidase
MQTVVEEAPRMRILSVEAFEMCKWFLGRLVFAGLDFGDISIALDGFKVTPSGRPDWREWHDRWLRLGQNYARSARNAQTAGQHLTARQWLLKATACGHFAEFMYFDEAALKRQTRMWVTHTFLEAIPYLPHPTWRFSVAYKDLELPAYIIRPAGPGPHPCVLLVNGLDSAKEVELHAFAQSFLDRGMAVVLFDGPGQGELLGVEPLVPEFEEVVGAVLAQLRDHDSVDPSRIGIFGVSYGGYLATRAAAFHPQAIKACINLAGTFDLDNYSSINPLVRKGFRFVFMKRDDAEMGLLARERLHLRGAPRLSRPLLCIHGEEDNLFPYQSCLRVMDWAQGPRELISYSRELHVATNYFADFIPRFGDWMAQHLGASALGSLHV